MKIKNKFLLVALLILVIIITWFFSGYFIYTHFGEDKGSIGDLFSPINALFAGLAFCGIIMTIYLQQKELSLQRQELINTREIFQKQKFENTFFQLTATQQSIIGGIHHEYTLTKMTNGAVTSSKEVKLDGRKLFSHILADLTKMHEFIFSLGSHKRDKYSDSDHSQLSRMFVVYKINAEFSYDVAGIYKDINLKDDFQLTKFLYQKVYAHFVHDISHYFSHLYKIIVYISETEKQELNMLADKTGEAEIIDRYQRYADFLQAQLSSSELILIFYHSFFIPDIKALIEKYKFLNTVTPDLLISPLHESWDIKAT